MHVQALTWQGKAPKQQDSLLIVGNDTTKIIQHKGLIDCEYQFDADFLMQLQMVLPVRHILDKCPKPY